ncbi:hypothetical protein KSB_60660 [Ktedonobacter robiniae]|uniref:Transposase DDE domain-containing protein n=1 Tax=Ktedonobacter robiniae TaxID=2778365 RepID=A0ABQ3UXI9_9CHLR|nr:hypothetical protein KSB_60660 [Ktedonobacter robiniae]
MASLYRPAERERPPVAPAMLALALIVEAYTGVSDDEVIEATVMDRRWQLVLDCLDCEHAPFGDLDTGLIRAVGITPANTPEASVTEAISADLERQQVTLKELHIDRAYLSSHLVRERSKELEVYCKAWPVREGKRFHKQMFTLDWDRQIIRYPAEQEMPFAPGGVVHFPKDVCAQCPLKAQCTTSAKGRSVSIHPDEAWLIELRARQQTPQGRAQLRERVAVEHSLAHVGRWQGRRARYCGVRKKPFDLRRCAVVHNLHVLARFQQKAAEVQEAA